VSLPATAEVHIKAGTAITDATGKVVQSWKEDTVITLEKSGWFLSDFYMSEVAKAKVGK
jgi:hypothetical protein